MPRLLNAVLLAVLLVGCDATGDASIQYEVRAAGDAQAAEVSVDGAAARTVPLPFSAESSGATFAILAASDAALDVTVRVDGAVRERATGRVVRLSGDADGDEVEVRGPIEALAADALTVRGLTFVVTAETEIEGDDDDVLALADLLVDARVEVEGHVDRAGVLIADEIELDDADGDDADDEVEVEGRIEALSAGALTVAGLTFTVTETTEVEGDDDRRLRFDDLAVGDRVEVEGSYDADGALVADEIELDDEGDSDDNRDGDDD